MIVIDTSALIAITNHEPERRRFLEIIAAAERCVISAVTLLEARMVVYGRFGPTGADRLAELLDTLAPEIAPFDAGQADGAMAAFSTYGKNIHAQARLNLCDCVSYALAKGLGLPLLYKGQDFAATDIAAAT